MSRTLKDRPNYMRELDNLRKNELDHDHASRGWRDRVSEYQRHPIWGVNGNWKREFMAHETPALREFKAALEAEGYSYDEKVVFEDTHLEAELSAYGNYRDEDHRYREITVIQPYTLKKSKFRHTTEYCSAGHLALGPGNYRWWVDTRDGLLANCTPVSDFRGSVPKRIKQERVIPRTNANRAMWEAVKDFNSGNLDDTFDSSELYVTKRHYGSSCHCCW